MALTQELWANEDMNALCPKKGCVPYKRYNERDIENIEKLLGLKLTFVTSNFEYVFESNGADKHISHRMLCISRELPESYYYVQQSDIYNQEEQIYLTNEEYYLILKWSDPRLRGWRGVRKYKEYNNKRSEYIKNYVRKEKHERFKRLSPRDNEIC